ncbi:MAG: ATP-grasp domain-containing protein, partial [Candidatus Bathyarchaeia archaeon]
ILDIVEKEAPIGVVVSVGGQTPNNLAKDLSERGVRLMGTPAESIDWAEDRSKFSRLLDTLGIGQPEWRTVESPEEAASFAEEAGYPVIVRPSYVLSGSAMSVASDEKELRGFFEKAARTSGRHPVVVSKFVSNAREVEVDAVCDGRHVFIGAIIEHVEEAGVHSGDATMSIPPLTLSEEVKDRIRESTRRIARRLGIRGPFNIQYLVKNGEISIIECNLRASRSMPYVSKAIGVNLMELAADAILGGEVPDGEGEPLRYCVKVPQFSFMRLDGADPVTGVEMVSTGEVACFGDSFEEALLKALTASGMEIPRRGDPILISVGGRKDRAVEIARKLADKGFRIYATEHTSEALRRTGVDCETVYKVREAGDPNVLDLLAKRRLKFVINTPSPEAVEARSITDGYLIRRKAVEFGVPIVTNLELADNIADAL